MRTSIDIEDDLLTEVKIYALRNGITLKELVTKLLEIELEEKNFKNKVKYYSRTQYVKDDVKSYRK